MPDSVRNLQEDALKLSEKQRAELARMLLLSLDEPEDQATNRCGRRKPNDATKS